MKRTDLFSLEFTRNPVFVLQKRMGVLAGVKSLDILDDLEDPSSSQ